MADHSVQPSVKLALGHAIQDALGKAEYNQDRVFADQLIGIFREAAAKAEAVVRTIPASKPSQPHWP